jgi:hypothetical protein
LVANYDIETVNPDKPDGPPVKVTIPAEVSTWAFKHNPVRYQNLMAARDVLVDPKRIFWGIRQFSDGGWCYCGRPEQWTIKEGVVATFPDNLVYTVYVDPRWNLFEWRAAEAADDDPMCPVGWRERYRGLRWKSTS